MNTLIGDHILLRALETSDLNLLYYLENDESVWEVSNTITPYSKYVLKQYLNNAHNDIYQTKQLRLVIALQTTKEPVGFVDLFNFSPKHKRVGVGVVIFPEENRKKGYARESLQILIKYVMTHLGVHQVYANITEDNKASISLFKSIGFIKTGTKIDWIVSGNTFKNELIFQYFK